MKPGKRERKRKRAAAAAAADSDKQTNIQKRLGIFGSNLVIKA